MAVYARHSPDRLPRQALDDAAVCWLRIGARHERTLQVSAFAGPDRTFGRVRLPDTDGLRRRSSPFRGRGRQDRRVDFVAGGHGDAVRGNSTRQGLHVDDDQRTRADPVLFLHCGGREAGRAGVEDPRHRAERHPEGVHGAACLVLPDRAGTASHRRRLRVECAARAAVQHDLDFRLSHSRGGIDGGTGAGLHARRRLHVCRARHRARTRRRFVRTAPVVLLRHPQRFLRGDRQAACGTAHLGTRAA